jgi:hypothetical protein
MRNLLIATLASMTMFVMIAAAQDVTPLSLTNRPPRLRSPFRRETHNVSSSVWLTTTLFSSTALEGKRRYSTQRRIRKSTNPSQEVFHCPNLPTLGHSRSRVITYSRGR